MTQKAKWFSPDGGYLEVTVTHRDGSGAEVFNQKAIITPLPVGVETIHFQSVLWKAVTASLDYINDPRNIALPASSVRKHD